MNELNALELKLLGGLVRKYPSLEPHIAELKVTERKSSGTGMYVYF